MDLKKIQAEMREKTREEFGEIGEHRDCIRYGRVRSGCYALTSMVCQTQVCQFYQRRKDGDGYGR